MSEIAPAPKRRRRLTALIGGGLLLALLLVLGALCLPMLLAGPQIVAITPQDGATDASPQHGVQIRFNQWVPPEAVATAVRFEPALEVSVEADSQPTLWGSSVLIRPVGGFKYGASYRVMITGDIRNLLGRTSGQSRQLAFTTAPYLVVQRTTPEDASGQIALDAPITVEFDRAVVSAETVAQAADDPRQAAQLPGGTDSFVTLDPPAQGMGRWLSPTLYGFYPQEPLRAATTYTVQVGPAITADGRGQLEQPTSWQFETAAPLLLGARPYDGATDVAADTPIEVRLAQDVDIASASTKFSLIEAATGTPVAGAISSTDQGFLFKPASALLRSTRYEARIAAGVTTKAGATLNDTPLSWKFNVIGQLEVAQVMPPTDASEVLTSTRQISVRFNHPVVAVTTIGAQADQPQPLTITPPLPGTGRWLDTSTYVYSPTNGLVPSTDYRVQVQAGLHDQTGGTLEQPYEWRFSTITPRVLGSLPRPDEQFASPSTPLQLVFNQPMDASQIQNTVQLRRVGGASVAGTVSILPKPLTLTLNESGESVGGFGVTFTPAAPLERGASYVLSVSQGSRAAQGNGSLPTLYQVGFQVAPLPRLLASTPSDGDSAVEVGQELVLKFSTPMDWASVERNLTVLPAPTNVYTSAYGANYSMYFSLNPETDYTVTLDGGAQDVFGAVLGNSSSIRFRSKALDPSLHLVGSERLGAYNAYVNIRVPLQSVNLPTLDYQLYRLDTELAPVLASDYERWNNYVPDRSDLLVSATTNISSTRNQQQLTLLDLGQLDPGMYYITIASGELLDRQMLAVSPYALTIKRSLDRLFVWAVDLSTAAPVENLELTGGWYSSSSRGGELISLDTQGRTDGDGVLQASLAGLNLYDQVFLWGTDERFVFGTTGWEMGITPWDFNLPADYDAGRVVGNLATDRPIYRPEQNVYIRGVLRMDHDGSYSLPNRDAHAFLAVDDPEGNTVISMTLPLDEFGTFNTSLPLARGTKLGQYRITANMDGLRDEGGVFGAFMVAEYRKPAFEVTLTPAKTDLIQGDTLEMRAEARYFSGGAVANAPLHWRVLAQRLYFSADSAPSYRFENLDDAYESYRWFDGTRSDGRTMVGEGRATTDAQGNFSLKLPATLGDQAASRRLLVDIEITDLDGQVIAGQNTVNVHAGAFYTGLRPVGYVAEVGQPQQIDLITVDLGGQPTANRQLELSFYKREWFSVRQQGSDGRFYFTSTYTDTLVTTETARTDGQGRGSVSFTPSEGGSYRIVAEGRDDHGNLVRASAFTWAYGGNVFWGVNDTNRIDLIADKDRYKPGEHASILVTAPYANMRALMTIERGEVLEHRLINLKGTSELLDVPIEADYAPNVYVSVVLVAPAGDDLPVPDLRVGLINLPVSTEQKDLTIAISADKQQAGPRDSVTYTIKATDYTGKGVKAALAVALVDKAVLALADDSNPTLHDSFYEKRPLGVFTASSLTALVDRVTLRLQAGDKGGGGGVGAEVLVRRNFPDTAYWNPALITDDDGTATFTIQLPDSLTTWQLSARGLTGDTLVGQASQEIVASRPLLVRPALPRFLTDGDAPVLQAVVQNNTANPIDATVTLALAASDAEEGAPLPLHITGELAQRVTVPANSSAAVRWPATVEPPGNQPSARQLRLTFNVDGGGQRDTVEHLLPIQRFTTPELVASAGQVLDTTVETISDPSGLPRATDATTSTHGQLELELVPSLGVGVTSGLTYLAEYPYGCVEQTVSRFLPNAVSYRLFRQVGSNNAELRQGLEQNLTAALQQLSSLQHLDGGWGWWQSDESNAYLTAYVVQGLLEARKAGYGVDQQMLDRALAFIEDHLDASGQARDRRATELNTRSFILFVLAEAGQPDRGRSVALFEQRAALGLYGRAYLLMNLHTLGDNDRSKTLISELMSSAVLNPTTAHWEEPEIDYWTMSSNTRSTALVLQALVRSDPQNFLVPNAVRYLMSLREDGHWRTTQESATTLMALAEYIAESGELSGNYSYRAALNGTTLREGKVDAQNLDDPINVVVALADLKAGEANQLAIQRQAAAGQSGQGRLYYTLRMRYYQGAAAVQPLDRGIAVKREYIAVNSDTLTPTGQLIERAALSEVVQVRLTLTMPQAVFHLAVEDMLPAGLEPLDTSLRNTSAAAQDPTLTETDGQLPYWWYFSQTEIHDNRVVLFATQLPKGTYEYTYLARATTPGSFQTLPTTAYQMYEPEVFGRSAGAAFVVTQP